MPRPFAAALKRTAQRIQHGRSAAKANNRPIGSMEAPLDISLDHRLGQQRGMRFEKAPQGLGKESIKVLRPSLFDKEERPGGSLNGARSRGPGHGHDSWIQSECRSPLLPLASEAVSIQNVEEGGLVEIRKFAQIDEPRAVFGSSHG